MFFLAYAPDGEEFFRGRGFFSRHASQGGIAEDDVGRNRFFERNVSATHRCSRCGSSAVAGQEDVRRGGLALKPAVAFWLQDHKGYPSAIPHATDTAALPQNTRALFAVSHKARSVQSMRRATALMLRESGFSEEVAADLAQGAHNVEVTASDIVGNDAAMTWQFSVDTIPPEITNPSPANNAQLADAQPELSVDIADVTSGVDAASLAMKIDNA